MSANHLEHLPIGQPIPMPEGGIPDWEIFPYEGDFRVKPLESPVLPEPPREGESAADCGECAKPDSDYLWTNGNWRVFMPAAPTPLPAVLLLKPRAHHDLSDLPDDLAAELGVLTVRIERAIMSLGGVGRVHINRWGDGAAHLHLWFIARPEGLLQLRGSCLPLWYDLLPALPDAAWQANREKLAAALEQ